MSSEDDRRVIESQQATIALQAAEIVRLNKRIESEYTRYQELWTKHAAEREKRQQFEQRYGAFQPRKTGVPVVL